MTTIRFFRCTDLNGMQKNIKRWLERRAKKGSVVDIKSTNLVIDPLQPKRPYVLTIVYDIQLGEKDDGE